MISKNCNLTLHSLKQIGGYLVTDMYNDFQELLIAGNKFVRGW